MSADILLLQELVIDLSKSLRECIEWMVYDVGEQLAEEDWGIVHDARAVLVRADAALDPEQVAGNRQLQLRLALADMRAALRAAEEAAP